MQIDDRGEPHSVLVERLRQANAALLHALVVLSEGRPDEETSPHEFFGPFTARQWGAFQQWHDSDHATHARTIIGAPHQE